MPDSERPNRTLVEAWNATYHEGVRCVEMPCCGFTFDAGHVDSGVEPERYTCPLCSPAPGRHDAILGWLLREAIAEDGQKAVFAGIATHAYHLARDAGKQAAKAAADEARAEAHRLTNDNQVP